MQRKVSDTLIVAVAVLVVAIPVGVALMPETEAAQTTARSVSTPLDTPTATEDVPVETAAAEPSLTPTAPPATTQPTPTPIPTTVVVTTTATVAPTTSAPAATPKPSVKPTTKTAVATFGKPYPEGTNRFCVKGTTAAGLDFTLCGLGTASEILAIAKQAALNDPKYDKVYFCDSGLTLPSATRQKHEVFAEC